MEMLGLASSSSSQSKVDSKSSSSDVTAMLKTETPPVRQKATLVRTNLVRSDSFEQVRRLASYSDVIEASDQLGVSASIRELQQAMRDEKTDDVYDILEKERPEKESSEQSFTTEQLQAQLDQFIVDKKMIIEEFKAQGLRLDQPIGTIVRFEHSKALKVTEKKKLEIPKEWIRLNPAQRPFVKKSYPVVEVTDQELKTRLVELAYQYRMIDAEILLYDVSGELAVNAYGLIQSALIEGDKEVLVEDVLKVKPLSEGEKKAVSKAYTRVWGGKFDQNAAERLIRKFDKMLRRSETFKARHCDVQTSYVEEINMIDKALRERQKKARESSHQEPPKKKRKTTLAFTPPDPPKTDKDEKKLVVDVYDSDDSEEEDDKDEDVSDKEDEKDDGEEEEEEDEKTSASEVSTPDKDESKLVVIPKGAESHVYGSFLKTALKRIEEDYDDSADVEMDEMDKAEEQRSREEAEKLMPGQKELVETGKLRLSANIAIQVVVDKQRKEAKKRREKS